MSYLHSSILFFCIALFGHSCKAQKISNENGLVVVKTRYLDTKTNQFIKAGHDRDYTMWFKDSLIIQEIEHIYQNTSENRNIEWKVVVERYKFIDLKTREIYEYHTFADTAKMIKKCVPDDSSCIKECWKFWSSYSIMDDSLINDLSDTIINSVKYKRLQTVEYINTEKGKLKFTKIAYLRCDTKNLLFMFSPALSKKLGCPIVRYEEHNEPLIYTDVYTEIDYLPRKLSKEELKVFAAWEKNARAYNAARQTNR